MCMWACVCAMLAHDDKSSSFGAEIILFLLRLPSLYTFQ